MQMKAFQQAEVGCWQRDTGSGCSQVLAESENPPGAGKEVPGVVGREVATPPQPPFTCSLVCPFSCLLSALMENHTQNSEVNFPHLSRLSRYPMLSGPPLQRFSDLFFILHRLAIVQVQSRTIPYSWLPTLSSQSKPCLHLYASFQVLQENLCSSTPLLILPGRNGHLPSVPTAAVLFSF